MSVDESGRVAPAGGPSSDVPLPLTRGQVEAKAAGGTEAEAVTARIRRQRESLDEAGATESDADIPMPVNEDELAKIRTEGRSPSALRQRIEARDHGGVSEPSDAEEEPKDEPDRKL